MPTREHLVRALWTLFEPIHAVSYFSTQGREAFAAIGLTRYWDGYFAGRSAPLGAVGGAPVAAIFSGFAPEFVDRALPGVWSIASPERVLEARSLGAAATLRDLISDGDAVAAAAALTPVALGIDGTGRPLSASNRVLPVEDDPYRQLWQAATTLREHRGDGHVISLVAGGIAGLTTLVLRGGVDLDPVEMRRARGWDDARWAEEEKLLVARGLLAEDGRITGAGAEALNRAERLTNRLAAGPWAGMDDEELLGIAAVLAPISRALAGLFPYPNPIGMPVPWNPEEDPEASLVPPVPVV
jgi:hypothetical protein